MHKKRYFRNRLDNEKNGYNYAFGRMIIGRKIDFSTIEKELEEGGKFTEKLNTNYIKKLNSGFSYEYVDGVSGRCRDLSLELNLEKGEYYVIIIMDWNEQIFDVTLSCYGEQSVEFSRVDYRKNSFLLEEIIGSHAFENIFPLETNNNSNEYKNYKYFAKKEALIIECFENIGDKAVNIIKSYQNLHHIFKLARKYEKSGNKICYNGMKSNGEMGSNVIASLQISPKEPGFICIKFTNMDRYNIIGLDKNVLK